MRWPWVKRAMYYAAENLRLEAQQRLGQSEVARVKEGDAARERYETVKELLTEARMRLTESENERKLLLDRIVQMTGQPPIYERTKPVDESTLVSPPPAGETPEATRQITFDDIHASARRAMRDGTFTIPTAHLSARRPN